MNGTLTREFLMAYGPTVGNDKDAGFYCLATEWVYVFGAW